MQTRLMYGCQWGSLAAAQSLLKAIFFYYKSCQNPYQYYKSCENLYQVLQVMCAWCNEGSYDKSLSP